MTDAMTKMWLGGSLIAHRAAETLSYRGPEIAGFLDDGSFQPSHPVEASRATDCQAGAGPGRAGSDPCFKPKMAARGRGSDRVGERRAVSRQFVSFGKASSSILAPDFHDGPCAHQASFF